MNVSAVILGLNCIAIMGAQTAQDPAVIDLAAVVKMDRAGIGEDVIAAVIRSAGNAAFDVSPAGLVAMKEAGLSDTILRAVLERTRVSPSGNLGSAVPSGVVVVAGGREVRLTPSVVMQAFSAKEKDLTAKVIASGSVLGSSVALQYAASLVFPAAMAMGRFGRHLPAILGSVIGPTVSDQAEKASQNRQVRAREFIYVQGSAAPEVRGPLTFRVPVAGIELGRYTPVLLGLTVLQKEDARLIETREVILKGSKDKLDRPVPEIETLTPPRQALPAEVRRETSQLVVSSPPLDAGSYALLFREQSGRGYAEQAFAFRVTQ